MKEFDKMIRELSRNVEIPKEYNQRVDSLLNSLPEKEQPLSASRGRYGRWLAVILCVIAAVCVLSLRAVDAKAGIWETFRTTLLELLHIGGEEGAQPSAVESARHQVAARPDLMLELSETVIDGSGMYLLVKVTAPPELAFSDNVKFDYFGFCEGENYNVDDLIPGIRDCVLVETMDGKPNVAAYVMNLAVDMGPYEGKYVTAFFKDLVADQGDGNTELLVEGLWSITFSADLNVKEQLEAEADSDIRFSYLGATASFEGAELTPLGLTVVYDVSEVQADVMGVSDTTIEVRLRRIDGSEVPIRLRGLETEVVSGSSSEFYEENGSSYQKDLYSFGEAMDITKVIGMEVEGMYVPFD